jgi:NAD(P)-dependent dehydrogenase (short-subunit alcohol dehydrogenase family)
VQVIKGLETSVGPLTGSVDRLAATIAHLVVVLAPSAPMEQWAQRVEYSLFGAAEKLSDDQIDHIIATNLVGSIQLIRAALPDLRAQGGGRIIQVSSYAGQVAFPGNSMYHAPKWGDRGFRGVGRTRGRLLRNRDHAR